ncbi:hypothetical protein QBZ16_003710 [Prototheca wickerhamii]|uniref:Uncharacterized protein n=1 Tax=Prototheca wickerhamii TaxID=3111 RepID=A0AAD9IGI9_PROWI|nr:hypothetical protein QBZ16_003710 [Prototheca wickerhamii]
MGTPVHRPVEFMKPIWSIVTSSPLISHWGWRDVAHMQLQLPEAAPRQGVWTSQVEVTKDEASRVVEVMAQLALPGGLWSPAAALPPRNDPGSDWQLDIKSTPTVAYNKTSMEAVMSVKLASVPRCAAAGSCALHAVVMGLPVPHKIGQPYQREAGEAVYDASQVVQRIAIRYHNAAMEFTSVTIWLQRTAVPCFSDCQSKFFRYDLD